MMRRWARPLQMLDDVDVPSVSRGFTLGSEVDDETVFLEKARPFVEPAA